MKKRIMVLVLCLALVFCAMTGCGSGSGKQTTAAESEKTTLKESEDIYVFAAASLSNAMKDIQTEYAKEHSAVNIIFNTDSSGTLQKQIEEGAQCDIFFSAAEKQMNALQESGYVEASEVVNLLENKVVLIKPAGGETKVTGFDNITEASNLALAGEDVPVGQYARKIFDKLGITDQVMAMEINEGANVTAVLTAVSEHSNEVGIVYATDAASMKDSVEIIAQAGEAELDTPVIYPIGLVKDDQASEGQTAAAKEFYDYLQSEAAAAIFGEYGFSMN